jgi:hypothetical protein
MHHRQAAYGKPSGVRLMTGRFKLRTVDLKYLRNMIMSQRLLLIVLVFFTISGCTRVNVVSTRLSSYSNNINKLLIVINTANFPGANVFGLEKSFVQKFQAVGVSAEVLMEEALELNSGEAKRKAVAKFKPTHILTLECMSYSGRDGFGFEGSLYDRKMCKQIWRVDISSTNLLDALAEKIIEKLQMDALLNQMI